MKVTLQPTVLQWARRRAGLSTADLGRKLSTDADQVSRWEADGIITYKRAEKLAEKTHTPFGYLFLPEPPEERLPVADFRTLGSEEAARPSPELLDVLYDGMRKQAWYREYLIELGEPRLEFIGSARLEDDPTALADLIRTTFHLGTALRAEAGNWETALTLIFEHLEDQGVLVLRSGVADGNPHRPLLVEEFRGFALSDPYAPVIFINTRDSQAAQMFTVAHELVHIWLGLSGVSNPQDDAAQPKRVELVCNAVAAEILVPVEELWRKYDDAAHSADPVSVLVRHFKVSSLVILRRLHDIHVLDWETYRKMHQDEVEKFRQRQAKQKEKPGGNYYATQQVRVGRRFARALIGSALEGRTTYREAFSLLGVRKTSTFNELARKLHFDIR
jgi:Zn-dependent peptidase ImmA (M78 family)